MLEGLFPEGMALLFLGGTWRRGKEDLLSGGDACIRRRQVILIDERVQAAVKVVDDKWWRQVDGAAGPQDKKWWDLRDDFEDALEAWRTNPLAFRVVALTTDYVVGNGIQISSPVGYVERFVSELWAHRQNKMRMRIYTWCEELVSGFRFGYLSTFQEDPSRE